MNLKPVLLASCVLALTTTTLTTARNDAGLAPRQLPKATAMPLRPAGFTGRLVVKFVDSADARATEAGLVASSALDMSPITQIFDDLGLTAEQAIAAPQWKIDELELRAQIASGRAQPDLASMMYLYGPDWNLDAAVEQLHGHGLVEWITYEEDRYPGGDPSLPRYPRWYEFEQIVAQQAQYDEQKKAAEEMRELARAVAATDDLQEKMRLVKEHEKRQKQRRFDLAKDEIAAEILAGGDPACGEAGTGNCWDPEGTGSAFCEDLACCEAVGELLPSCAEDDGEWDFLCAALANLTCDPHTPNPDGDDDGMPDTDPPTGPDRCRASILNGSCFEIHDSPGCQNNECCNTVCALVPNCCEGDLWGGICVATALESCGGDTAMPDDPTPDLTLEQGYLTPDAYADPPPPALGLPTVGGAPAYGFNGQGWNLEVAGDPFTDQNGNNWWDLGEPYVDADGNGIWTEPSGLWGLAEELLYADGVDGSGMGNLTRGLGAKVAVIEFGCFTEHEEFTRLEVDVDNDGNVDFIHPRRLRGEPGQRIFDDPEIAAPDHGTACASIILARDESGILTPDGDNAGLTDTGVRGIVPEATGVFYPTTSINEGPRELAAWFNAIFDLSPGDVMSASYGPPTNLNNAQATWTLFRVASDLGITVCLAAGNNCTDLAAAADDLGDSGAIVVGACSPGKNTGFGRGFRLAFSNFVAGAANVNPALSNTVHLNAWGGYVASAGYADRFLVTDGINILGDPNRRYTSGFGGTSAATPQIAGVVAAMQGLAKQFYGISIAPETMRTILGAPVPTWAPITPILFGGSDDPCAGDTDPEQEPRFIGQYPNIAGSFDSAASTLLNQSGPTFDDAPLVDDIVIVVGDRTFGNVFSIKGDDTNILVIEPTMIDRGFRPDADGGGIGTPGGGIGGGGAVQVPEIDGLTYLSGGLVTDWVVVGHSDATNPTDMTVESHFIDPELFNVVIVEALDHFSGRWTFLAANILPGATPGAEVIFNNEVFAARRFIRQSDKRIFVRMYTVGFPGFNNFSGPDNYKTRIDLIDIRLGELFGEG